MCIAFELVVFPTNDQDHLRVRLIADESEHDLNARFGQSLCELDVFSLVKSRSQFDRNHDLFTSIRRVNERFDNWRIVTGPIERLANRNDVRVDRSLP